MTAASLVASTARWNPPMPLMARISPASETVDGFGDGIGRWNLQRRRRDEPERGPQSPAGVGLRVEAAVGRIVVLGLAGRAHFEARHRGLRAVVGNAARDGEARAAVGAVEEGIAVAAIVGIEQFAQAIGAGGGVGGNAGRDAGRGPRWRRCGSRFRRLGASSRTATESMRERGGASARRRRRKDSMRCGRPFDFDGHAARIVADEAGQSLLRCEAIDEGTEADALHDAADCRRRARCSTSCAFSFWMGFLGQREPRTGVKDSAWTRYDLRRARRVDWIEEADAEQQICNAVRDSCGRML